MQISAIWLVDGTPSPDADTGPIEISAMRGA
jgi:hypothetical protein